MQLVEHVGHCGRSQSDEQLAVQCREWVHTHDGQAGVQLYDCGGRVLGRKVKIGGAYRARSAGGEVGEG